MKQIFTLSFFCLWLLSVQSQNHAINFDGIEGHLQIGHSADYNIGDGFTVEAWINANEWKSEFWAGSIIAKDRGEPESGFALRAGKNGTLSFVIGTPGWPETVSQPIMNTKQWYHVAGVYDNGVTTLYINGAEVASNPTAGALNDNTMSLRVGESSGFPGRVFDGAVDEVRVWSYARTAGEINDNQMTDFSGFESGLVAYFPMNEGSGLMTDNLVGSGNDATFDNGLDESAWVDGYSVPARDIGVVKILGPDEVNLFLRPIRVKVEIQNYGSEAAGNIPLQLIRNGLPTLTGTYEGTIQPGESAEFTFDQVVDFTNTNTNLILVQTTDPDDPNDFNDGFSYRYQRPDEGEQGDVINIFKEEQHNFAGAGQSRFNTVLLPADMSPFSKLLMHFSYECPSTGCDPWDQVAKLIVVKGNDKYEISRLVTPYGIGCGPWTIDVTDFKSILSGAVTFESFVQVWGPSGWLVNVDLELIRGDVANPYQKLSPLWLEDYWVYGDPDKNYDLPERSIDIENKTKTTHQRMTISGHGQGNTDNAAEFSQRTHRFMLNGAMMDNHFLWKNDCGQNTCSNQAGNWTPSRAGWCPGQNIVPVVQNLTGQVSPGSTITLDYELETYTNLLNTGYNGGSHTEPFYRIWSYVIESSDVRYGAYNNLKADYITIETNGDVDNPSFDAVKLTLSNNGTVDMVNPSFSYYVNDALMVTDETNITLTPGQFYTHTFSSVMGFEADEDHEVYGQIIVDGDENLGDDAVSNFLDADLSTSTKNQKAVVLNVYPNPTSIGLVTIEVPSQLIGNEIQVMDIHGRLLNTTKVVDEQQVMEVSTTPGIYFLNITEKDGQRFYQKVVVE